MRALTLLSILCLVTLPAWAAPLRADRTSIAVISYELIDVDDVPNASVRLDQFLDHISTLEKHGNQITPAKAISVLRGKSVAPENSYLITFDMGLQNQYRAAFPILIKKRIPFIVFIDPTLIDQKDPGVLRLDQIEELQQTGLVSFGYQPASFLPRDKKALIAKLNTAQARLREMTGQTAKYFAYSNGVFTPAYKHALTKAGFSIAFTQASGAASSILDRYAQPRFVMTENYADHDRFIRALNSLPLPIDDMTPTTFDLSKNPPLIGFSVDQTIAERYADLTCFASDNIKVTKQFIEKKRIELRLNKPFPGDRGRINCIMPETNDAETNRWRWLGFLFGG